MGLTYETHHKSCINRGLVYTTLHMRHRVLVFDILYSIIEDAYLLLKADVDLLLKADGDLLLKADGDLLLKADGDLLLKADSKQMEIS